MDLNYSAFPLSLFILTYISCYSLIPRVDFVNGSRPEAKSIVSISKMKNWFIWKSKKENKEIKKGDAIISLASLPAYQKGMTNMIKLSTLE